MRRVLAAIFFALAALALAACERDVTPELEALGGGCLLNSDCEGELVCVFRRCHVPCNDDPDCPLDPAGDHHRCLVGEKPSHICQLDALKFCQFHSDCPERQLCALDSQCHDQCLSDRDCLAGSFCITGVCVASGELATFSSGKQAQPLGGSCSYNSDCVAALVCRANVCDHACADDEDCSPLATALSSSVVHASCDTSSGDPVCQTGCAQLPLCSPEDPASDCVCSDGSPGSQTCNADCVSMSCRDTNGMECLP